MANVQVPMTDWGNLVSQIPQGIADVQNTNANTGVQQQQARGLGLANQLAGLGLQVDRAVYARALHDFSGQMNGNEAAQADQSGETGSNAPAAAASPASAASGTAGSGGPTGAAATPAAAIAANAGNGTQTDEGAPGGTPADPTVPVDTAGINQSLYNRWFVNPAGTPQEQRYLQDALLLSKVNPGLAAQAKARINANVATRNAIVKQQSNSLFTTMMPVADPKTPHPWTLLDRINPQAAQAVAAAAKRHGVDPDAAARQYATSVVQAAHQFTGRGITYDQAGVARDTLTGTPMPGVQPAGLSPYAKSKLASALIAPKTVKHPDNSTTIEPTWQADGYKSLAQAMLVAQGQNGQFAPGAPGANVHVAQTLAAAANAQKNAGTAAQVMTPQEMAAEPVLTKALNDKSFNLPKFGGANENRSPNAAQEGQQEAISKAYVSLPEETEETAQNANTQITYLQAAQKVLSDPKFTDIGSLGLSGTVASAVARVWNGGSATGRQEAAKYLSNAALQYARQLYGSRMTQTEVKMQLEDMNPNAAQTPEALNQLLGEQLRIAQYYNKGAQLAPKYLQAQKNPINFYKWYTKWYPMSDIVNQRGTTAAPAGNAAWSGTAPAQQNRAIALLKSNPKLASQFESKYGFLPKGM